MVVCKCELTVAQSEAAVSSDSLSSGVTREASSVPSSLAEKNITSIRKFN